MARKKNLADVQETFDSWFPNSGYKVSVYNGSNRDGYLEDSLGRQYRFSRFSNLKQCGTVEGLKAYLDSALGSQPTITHHTTSISISGDRNTTVHNSPHSTVASTPDPLTPLLQSQNQLVNYLSAVSEELPSTVNAALSILIANLQQAQQNLRPKSEV